MIQVLSVFVSLKSNNIIGWYCIDTMLKVLGIISNVKFLVLPIPPNIETFTVQFIYYLNVY